MKKEVESQNRPITADKIEAVIKKLPTHKSPGPDGFTGQYYKAFKGEITHILQRLFKKFKKIEDSPSIFMKLTSSLSQNQIKTQ